MVLELALSGSISLDASEKDLFVSQTPLMHYLTKIFFDNLVAGDEVIIRVYDQDEDAATEKKYRTVPVEGPQTNPEILVNWIPSSSYRVTCQQITGTGKNVTFALYTS